MQRKRELVRFNFDYLTVLHQFRCHSEAKLKCRSSVKCNTLIKIINTVEATDIIRQQMFKHIAEAETGNE